MKFLSPLLATVALATASVAALEDGLQLSEVFGGPHGNKYSDLELVSPGQSVKSITIRTGERLNGVGLDIADPAGVATTLYHGGGGGAPNTITMGKGEYITGIEAHWGEYHSHTRIRFIQFTTNANNTISGGTRTTKIGKDTAPEGYQLGGFVGTCGKEIDSVGAIWTRIKAEGDDSDDPASQSDAGSAQPM